MKYATLILAGLCIAMFVVQSSIGTDAVILQRSLISTEPWRLITSIFAHDGIGHLLSNMFALVLFGLLLEVRIGSGRLVALFLGSGLLVNVLTPYEQSLGASGAIMGIIGALTVLSPRLPVWVAGLPMPLIFASVVWLVQDFVGIFVPSTIGHIAHLIGLVLGVAVGFFWRKQFGDHKKKSSRVSDKGLDSALDDYERRYRLR